MAICFAQADSIYIEAKLGSDLKKLEVNQEIIFVNRGSEKLDSIKLLNWISAYKKRATPLLNRKLEDRNKDLYFAKPEELGNLENLSVTESNSAINIADLNNENLFIKLAKSLLPGESVKLQLKYSLKLPKKDFTGYGTTNEEVALKYFFIVPDRFLENTPRSYVDIEENVSFNTHWTVNFSLPANYYSKSNLAEIHPNYFQELSDTDPEFLISQKNYPSVSTSIDGKNVKLDFGYNISPEELQNLEFYFPLQLKFIKEKTGILPEHLFISEKFKKKEDFFGNDDIKFWQFRFKMFSNAENTDLDYFSLISKKILEQQLITYKQDDHWFKNGLKSYLEMQYLKANYPDKKLLGDLPENAALFGIKPLKIFYASKLPLAERYGLAYQYMMTENLDQKITEPFTGLSNFNEMAISNFEMGSLLNFVAEKMERAKFEDFLRNYLAKNSLRKIDTKDFLNELTLASGYSADFLEKMIQHKSRNNFNLKSFKKEDGQFQVKIKKNTDDKIPFKLETETKSGEKSTYWFESGSGKQVQIYNIPQENAEKITLNDGYIFPEPNFRDNYLYTKGLFSNMKKIRFKLLRDIPNPEYNEIYLNPRANFNAYDKVLLGLNFKNKSLFSRKFQYSLTPYFSTGTGKITGSGAVSYTFQPAESFYRNLDVGVSGSYFHYDYGLSYRKFGGFASLDFRKPPRSTVSRNIGISYSHYEKDLSPEMILKNEYDKYNLWTLGYGYSDSRLIHEHYIGASAQVMEDFQKITAESYYRWEYAKNKKISFRLFAGYFLNNKTRTNIFDYGISRVSNYSFSVNLLGQSATSGLLSQQFILADGGFKSLFNTTANKWITAFNVDSHVWKMFNIYADAGMYQNKGENSKFIYDSGIKVRVIPDFLEIYLPVQSSLGFEPSFKDYGKRIRFTLVLNLNAVVNTLRRGWY